MANISVELAAIMSAIYGRDVRGSIHDAIYTINDECEKIFLTGATDPTGNADYSKLLYLNETTWDLFKSGDTSPYTWTKIGNIDGNAITDITGPVTDPSTPLVDTYTINFSKAPSITFDVTNGRGITSITKTGSVGLVDGYTIAYNDGTSSGFFVTNGKDGNTVIRGNEVTGTATAPTQFTLTVDCQTGDTYINTSGNVYTCTSGADAGDNSLWKFDFAMTGGGGAQYLDDLTDVDTSGAVPNNLLGFDGAEWKPVAGGNGHTMSPQPTPPATAINEDDVVRDFRTKASVPANNEVASIFSIANWSNLKRIRVICPAASMVGAHTGIGTWDDVTNEADWWYNAAFRYLDPTYKATVRNPNGYDVDFNIKFDPAGGETPMLGGYRIDTTTGKVCLRFANYLIDPTLVKIAIDITFTRTDVG